MPPPDACRAQTGAKGGAAQQAAHLVVQQDIRPLGVVGAADQHDVALAGGDPRTGDAHGVGAAGFLAHEGARRADHAMHDGDIAGQQVGQLRQEQRRTQIAQQMLVQIGARVRRPSA